jgi:hypothetical protein
MYSVLNCHNVAKHTKFYMKYLRFNATFTSNAGCFKKSFTVVFQMFLCGECYENVYTYGIQTIQRIVKLFFKHPVLQPRSAPP